MSEISSRFNVSTVTARLMVGGGLAGADEVEYLKAQGVTHIISVAEELDDGALCAATGLACYHVRWRDDGRAKDIPDFIQTLIWLLSQDVAALSSGKQIGVFVHCAAGINRGPTMATFLLAALSGLPADRAWQMITDARPQAHGYEVPAYRQSVQNALDQVRPFRTAPQGAVPPAPAGTEPEAAAQPAQAATATPTPVAVAIGDGAAGITNGKAK